MEAGNGGEHHLVGHLQHHHGGVIFQLTIHPHEAIQAGEQLIKNSLRSSARPASSLKAANQTLLIKTIAGDPRCLGDTVGVIEQHIAGLEHHLPEAVFSLWLETDQ